MDKRTKRIEIMDNQVGNIVYREPKERFTKVSKYVIDNYDPLTIGIYCKIINLSRKLRLNIKFISEIFGVSKAKVRATIVFLEKEGFIQRIPVKDEAGKMRGWMYVLQPEQLPLNERTCAGQKAVLSENRVVENPTSRLSDKSETDKDIYKDYKDNKDYYNNKTCKDKKISPYGDTKNLPENERIFYEGMLENYPNVCKLDDPLTYKQYKKLQEKYDTSIITDVLMAMENKKDLTKKYRSAYLTLNKWIQLEKERSSK